MYKAVKTHFARWIGILTCAVVLAGALTVSATAASVNTISATISPDIAVKVDGKIQTFFAADGTQLHPIVYHGTTYLPLRAIGELMNKNVDWNQSNLTITLSGTRTAAATTGIRDVNPVPQTVQAYFRPDFTIVVDGVSRTFTDTKGDPTYPMLYRGTTYLPLRAIGGLMGKTVSWDSATRTAILSSSNSDETLVTDADSFGKEPGVTQTPPQANVPGNNTGSYIGEEKAKTIALNHAGLTESQVTFMKAKLDYSDGYWKYDVEFDTADHREYEYDIDAYTGTILKFDYDTEDWSAPPQNTNTSQIGMDKAKAIAVSHAGLNASQVTFVKAELDYDDDRWEYEIKFISGIWEYECEIDAYNGAVLNYEKESIYD